MKAKTPVKKKKAPINKKKVVRFISVEFKEGVPSMPEKRSSSGHMIKIPRIFKKRT
jgi:hypothetical protein